MKRKKPLEIIEIGVERLEQLKSRLASCSLLEEDKSAFLAIVTAYVWIQGQLESAKLTIHRLKKMFGFDTEKRKNSSEKGKKADLNLDLSALGVLNKQQEVLNVIQATLQGPPTKK